jgi:hypothetical protein
MAPTANLQLAKSLGIDGDILWDFSSLLNVQTKGTLTMEEVTFLLFLCMIREEQRENMSSNELFIILWWLK